MSESNSSNDILNLTAQIVAAHVSNNSVTPANLPTLIEQVFHALTTTGVKEPEPATLAPAVPIKRSVLPDHIVCLEDGEKFQMLKRHLSAVHARRTDPPGQAAYAPISSLKARGS